MRIDHEAMDMGVEREFGDRNGLAGSGEIAGHHRDNCDRRSGC